MLQIVSIALILIGAGVMVHTTFLFHAFIRDNRQEVYTFRRADRWTENGLLALLYLFIFGFLVGFVDTIIRDVEPIFTFVVVIFFFGSFFIFSAVKSQIAMAARLRDKTMEVMRTFVNAIDMKDSYTKGHSEHIYEIIGLLHEKLPEELRQRISKPKLQDAAMLHDCGKISVKDEILNKAGPLTAEDWASIKTHPLVGKKMLDDTCFREISSWVLYHHERMDGKGYYGLPGADIPVEARLIAIADTYSALSTNRVYRRRLSHGDAVQIMRQVAGTQLDAKLLECFLKIDPRVLVKLLPEEAAHCEGAQQWVLDCALFETSRQ